MQEITLNATAARRWLAAQAMAVEDGEDYDVDIHATWEPADAGEERTCIELVYKAQTEAERIIEGLGARTVDLIFEDDEDGGTYLFTVDFPARYAGGSGLKLADPYRTEVRKIGDRDSNGAEAAVAILQEAVTVANRLSSTLADYTRSYVLVIREPDAKNEFREDGNVVTVDIDLSYDFDSTPNDEDEALSFVSNLGASLDKIPARSHVLGHALDTYATAVEDYPNASAVVEAYRITRQGLPRLMWALHDRDGYALIDGICSTCLTGSAAIEELVSVAESEANENEYDESEELHDATERLINCLICGYKHQPIALETK